MFNDDELDKTVYKDVNSGKAHDMAFQFYIKNPDREKLVGIFLINPQINL